MGNKESEMNDKGSFVISILKVGKPNKYTNGYELMYKWTAGGEACHRQHCLYGTDSHHHVRRDMAPTNSLVLLHIKRGMGKYMLD